MPKKKKERTACANCGDETTFPSNTTGPRMKLGWCVPCYKQAEKMSFKQDQSVSGVWVPPDAGRYKDGPGINRRTPFDSR